MSTTPVEEPQRRNRVIPGRIVDDGQAQTARNSDRQRFEDLRNHVGWRHQIEIMAPIALDVEKYVRQVRSINRLPLDELADVIVLAVDATQVATAEEHRPGAAPAAQHIFLAEMRTGRRNNRLPSDAALSRLAVQPISATCQRAERACRQPLMRDGGTFVQHSLIVEIQVRRIRHTSSLRNQSATRRYIVHHKDSTIWHRP
jgi:hypothetical protein